MEHIGDFYYCPYCHEQGWVKPGETPVSRPKNMKCEKSSNGDHKWKRDKIYQNEPFNYDFWKSRYLGK
ncbi:MAG: hypothetical protein II821_08645 [Treponema sp.]|nr:hypothetical protein [Treponema sp.]